ncbi:MAG: hypothetical protein KVP17_003593 [Porospora cf. gigantea B]|uniref:uncharacterized protein n=1 Tax=Porospora cf. gigantea B TaxID=2853592 RepID=UPI003571F4F8|nr:MAG: hypothetical protein KVP17_003593 [Porospora cf. gigantea B]
MKVDVVDHITPLRGQRLEKVKNKNELTETIDLEALLRDFGLQRDTAPIGSKATSSTLSESSFEDDRWVYSLAHSTFKKWNLNSIEIAKRPTIVKGDCWDRILPDLCSL